VCDITLTLALSSKNGKIENKWKIKEKRENKIYCAYINLGYWPSHFKMSNSIIIPKLNKASYNSSKIFKPIILLNMLSKLIKKVIGKRLQFQLISKNFIHPCQLGVLKQLSMIDAGVILMYLIYAE